MRRRGAWVGLGQYSETIALDAVRDPGFGAIQYIVIAVFFGNEANTLQVRSRIGLGEANTAAQFSGGELRQKLLLLRLRAGTLHTARHDQM